MVVTHAASQIFGERNAANLQAHLLINPGIKQLNQEVDSISKKNKDLASKLATEPAFLQAWASKDRSAITAAVKSFVDHAGVPGFVTIIDDKAKVFYSGDSPAKFGYPVRDQTAEVNIVLQESKWWGGASSLTVPGTLSITGMVPIAEDPRGIVAVSLPLNTEFLTGLQKKLELTDNLQNIDLLLFSVKDGRVDALTPGLLGHTDGGSTLR